MPWKEVAMISVEIHYQLLICLLGIYACTVQLVDIASPCTVDPYAATLPLDLRDAPTAAKSGRGPLRLPADLPLPHPEPTPTANSGTSDNRAIRLIAAALRLLSVALKLQVVKFVVFRSRRKNIVRGLLRWANGEANPLGFGNSF